MISFSQIKSYKSLQLKKHRLKAQKFLVEGSKSVFELLNSDYSIDIILVTPQFLDKNSQYFAGTETRIKEVSYTELSRISGLKTNDSIIAVADMKNPVEPEIETDTYLLALDGMNDPGNLGTIFRIADWYGIKNILASKNTVDFYNPKVIQASMGSFTRVNVFYGDLAFYFKKFDLPVMGACLNGESLYNYKFPEAGIILLGSESHGIDKSLKNFVNQTLTIPRIGGAESLNVASSCAVILDNLIRYRQN